MKNQKPRSDATPSRGTSDNLCKLLAERHPEKFVEWLFGPPSGPVKVLKTELSREPLRADAAILLESTEEIFHIEFQTTGQSHIPLPVRMLNYYALFKYRYPERRIQQALVLLKDDGADITDNLTEPRIVFRYELIKLWQQDPAPLLQQPDLLPLAVLCRADTGGGALLRTVANELLKVEDATQRNELFGMSRMLAGLVYAKDIVYEILRGSNMLEESVVYQDVLQQGVRRGRRAGKAESLLELIALRFGRVSPKQKKQIENLSLQQIKELFRAVVSFRDRAFSN